MQDTNILIWLPSPMGDAILCTPALRALRNRFESVTITFFANDVVRQVLAPCNFNDAWLDQKHDNPLKTAKKLKAHNFTHAVLFKNSFASALSVFLAAVPSRIGYAREARTFLLTEKLDAPKLPTGKFKPMSMLDYYLAIAAWLGCDTSDRNLELLIDASQTQSLQNKFPELTDSEGPIVVLVPGGAFGPSKCWPSARFAKTADWLVSNFNAKVVVSVSPSPGEKRIAEEICNSCKSPLINLAESPLTLGQLKALFSQAALVITNDTGPRHIATALRRKVITLFGPNEVLWTDTDYEEEIQLIGRAPCAPCQKRRCVKEEHLCMQSITVEMVCDAAGKMLEEIKADRLL